MDKQEAKILQDLIDTYSKTDNDKVKSLLFTNISVVIENKLLPKINYGQTKIDLIGVVGPLLTTFISNSKLAKKENSAIIAVPAIDGFNEIDINKYGRDKFNKDYCVMVPWKILKNSISIRANNTLYKIIKKNDYLH